MDPLLLASVGQNDIMMWSAIIDILPVPYFGAERLVGFGAGGMSTMSVA